MKNHVNITVIGGGPAGMAAATLAADQGARVMLLDENPRLGGQIYRGVETQAAANREILGAEYYRGQSLVDRLQASDAEHVAGATVWHISNEREIGVTVGDSAKLIRADHVIIATGAQERPFPVPGWTLPGVMNAGAAQVLLKSSGVLLPDPVFVGTGPLLYLIAHQYMRAGVQVAAVLDTTPRENYRAAVAALPGALVHMGQLWKGLGWIRELRASGTRFVRAVDGLEFTGSNQVDEVKYKVKGDWQTLKAQTVLMHQGVVPNVNLAMAVGCAHEWSKTQLCWHAKTDDWGVASVPGVSVAGDGAGIIGADSAAVAGRIAALGALKSIGLLDAQQIERRGKSLKKSLAQHAGLRRFLDVLYRPSAQFRVPKEDATLVCRCEEVTAGQVRDATALGCKGPNQLKSFTRAGMGACQGRFCGLTVSALIADELGQSVADVGAARLRAPIKPLELRHLTTLADME